MKKAVFIVLILIIAYPIFADPLDFSGSWKVENLFLNRLDVWSDNRGLIQFIEDGKTKAIKKFEFQSNGFAIITLSDGEKINAFYRIKKNNIIYLQPQGGEDTTLYIQPISNGWFITAFDWRYPDDNFLSLIAILSKE